MSPLFYQGLGAYAAVGTAIGLWQWVDVTRTNRGRGVTIRTNGGLGHQSFLSGLLWPCYIVATIGFLGFDNYRRWRKTSPWWARWNSQVAKAQENAQTPRRSAITVLGPDPPGRPTLGWPVPEGVNLQPARVPGPDADYGFSCAAGSSGQGGFVDLQRYGPHFVLRIRSLTHPVGEQAIMLTPQQVRNVASGCLMGLPPEPEPVPPPPPPPEPVRRTSWARLLDPDEP